MNNKQDILAKNAVLGATGEKLFKHYLEVNNIPSLYINQDCDENNKTDILFQAIQAKRPDFLINLNNIGSIFVDVKSRSKQKFIDEKESFFPLYVVEIQKLKKLQDIFSIPVWLAFVDKKTLGRTNNRPTFYLISISKLYKFYEQLTYNVSSEIYCVRIPNILFQQVHDKFSLDFSFQNIEQELVNVFSDRYNSFNKKILEGIKIIKDQKSNISMNNIFDKFKERFKNAAPYYCYDIEVVGIYKHYINGNLN